MGVPGDSERSSTLSRCGSQHDVVQSNTWSWTSSVYLPLNALSSRSSFCSASAPGSVHKMIRVISGSRSTRARIAIFTHERRRAEQAVRVL